MVKTYLVAERVKEVEPKDSRGYVWRWKVLEEKFANYCDAMNCAQNLASTEQTRLCAVLACELHAKVTGVRLTGEAELDGIMDLPGGYEAVNILRDDCSTILVDHHIVSRVAVEVP